MNYAAVGCLFEPHFTTRVITNTMMTMKTCLLHTLSAALLITGLMLYPGLAAASSTIAVSPPVGTTPTIFQLTPHLSTTGLDTLSARWDWESDGEWDTEIGPVTLTTHQYPDSGVYRVALELHNATGPVDTISALVGVIAGPFTAGPLNSAGLVESHVAGVTALVVSPDGRHLYAGGSISGSIAQFAIDNSGDTPALTWQTTIDTQQVDGLQQLAALVISPDGRHLYAAGYGANALSAFERDSLSGELTLIDVYRDGSSGGDYLGGVISLALSPDGMYFYTAALLDDAVSAFTRNDVTGRLTLQAAYRNEFGGVNGLDGAVSVEVSRDGRSVYAAGLISSSLVVFNRNPDTCLLSFADWYRDGQDGVDGLRNVTAVTVSRDGKNVYAAGSGEDAVSVFVRDDSTGLLTYSNILKNDVGGIEGLAGVRSLVVSPDDTYLYAAGEKDHAVVVFQKDSITGTYSPAHVMWEGVNVSGIAALRSLALSPDGQVLYASGYGSESVAMLSRDGDIVNTPPNASFTSSANTGSTDSTIYFDATGSFDAEISYLALGVRWDWESDGVWDEGYTYAKTSSHQYAIPGTYTVTLEVIDNEGMVGRSTHNIIILPTVIFQTDPVGLTVWVDGEELVTPVKFTGWVPGSVHVMEVGNNQSVTEGVRYLEPSWIGPGTAINEYTTELIDTVMTAAFNRTQFYIETAITPELGGLILPHVPGVWEDSGLVTPISVIPEEAYTFAGFSGDLTGTETPQGVLMDRPRSVIAQFALRSDITAPAVPTQLRAVDTPGDTGGSVTLTFHADQNPADAGITSYRIYSAEHDVWSDAELLTTVTSWTVGTDNRVSLAAAVGDSLGTLYFWVRAETDGVLSDPTNPNKARPINNESVVQADVDGNGEVDIWDVAVLAEVFGNEEEYDPALDLNADGLIDIWDIAVIAGNWGVVTE
jgi:6-phosphogluconolactonase (cycloisomerase 2 family)